MARFMLPFTLFLGAILMTTPAAAADQPETTAQLTLAGISFDDPPLRLPVTPKLQTALNQIAGDIGRHCTTQEAYGWRLQQTEQQRVNGIFSSAAAKLNTAGYNLAPQSPPSATRDITIFLAQRPAQDLLFLWSAGELGLVLLVCDAPSGAVETAPAVTPSEAEVQPAPKKAEIKVRKLPKPKPKPAAKSKPDAVKPKAEKPGSPAAGAPAAIGIDDLPPVVHESTTAPAIAPAPPKEAAKPAPEVTPEVKAMLESLPEKLPSAPAAVAPAPPLPVEAPKPSVEVPAMVVPPTQQ